jgi:transposase
MRTAIAVQWSGPPLQDGDLTDREWLMLAPLLPRERGRAGRPAHDSRVVIDGILWQRRTGRPWREMPARYGKWNSVYRRYQRWQQMGVWDLVAALLAEVRKIEERGT